MSIENIGDLPVPKVDTWDGLISYATLLSHFPNRNKIAVEIETCVFSGASKSQKIRDLLCLRLLVSQAMYVLGLERSCFATIRSEVHSVWSRCFPDEEFDTSRVSTHTLEKVAVLLGSDQFQGKFFPESEGIRGIEIDSQIISIAHSCEEIPVYGRGRSSDFFVGNREYDDFKLMCNLLGNSE